MSVEPVLSRWARRKREAAKRAAAPLAAGLASGTPGPGGGQALSSPGQSIPSDPGGPARAPAAGMPGPPVVQADGIAPEASRSTASRSAEGWRPGRGTDGSEPSVDRRDAGGGDRAPSEPPSLPDPQTLTPQSDFRPFMQAGVTAAQRNAALRQLFVDPHFNTMDGLDIYIDDYGRPDPIPPAMLAALQHARRLLARDDTPPAAAAATGEVRDDPDSRAPGQAVAEAGGVAGRGPGTDAAMPYPEPETPDATAGPPAPATRLVMPGEDPAPSDRNAPAGSGH
jgi:hypothetical protein